jgi:hypothetical protein
VTSPKLHGPRQTLIIVASALAGIGFFLLRRYHDVGRLGWIDAVATAATVVVFSVITVLVARKGNKAE